MATNLRRLGIAGIVLAACLYTWQVAAAWTAADNSSEDAIRLGMRGVLAGHNPEARELAGRGVAAGASATLYSGGSIGVLLLYGMPVLPPAQVYQMWSVDASGQVDASSIFRVPIGGQDLTIVDIRTLHALNSYDRFIITVEPPGGSLQPTSQPVMSN